MMTHPSKKDIIITAHIGDGTVLLAFDVPEEKKSNLAGFSIFCTPKTNPGPSNGYWLKNMLNFTDSLTKDKSLVEQPSTDSNKAPFQTFHWIHFPNGGPGNYQYTVYASYFTGTGVEQRQYDTVDVNLSQQYFKNLKLGFTRGYVSSQAYLYKKFEKSDIQPKPKSIDYDTTHYQDQYQWLGSNARKLVFDFLKECKEDASINVDVFVYDFDEPDIINTLCDMSSRVRVFQDNSSTHIGVNDLETAAKKKLSDSNVQTKSGHFGGLAHSKVMIQRRGDVATKVLTGSANFSIRGLYIQSNSVLVFDDPDVASLYEQAFVEAYDKSYNDTSQFKASPIALKWQDLPKTESRPQMSVSFAPHSTPFTIGTVSDAINGATSSVLFAMMEFVGGGDVVPSLKGLRDKNKILSLGITETKEGLGSFRPGMDDNSAIVPFAHLDKNIPEPFKGEISGGSGHVIHHKFIVCDFNGENPVVFCGSSNLASGGETSNGDNLIMINDKQIATQYAVEAIRLFDHYRFRSKQYSSIDKPILLSNNDDWVKEYYDEKNIKFLERTRLIAS